MSTNKGTLVGAPVRPNDSQDTYPVAFQEEVAGGRHTASTIADRDAIGAHLRRAGMQCYVVANGNTYQLKNDLVTWQLIANSAGGSTQPGSGGNSTTVQLISGNFGEWLGLDGPTNQYYTAGGYEYTPAQYKADLLAFPTRAIVYVQAQFDLVDTYAAGSITLGNIPVNARPIIRLKKLFIVQAIEVYLVIETNGDVKLISKDPAFNLPTGFYGDDDEPYYIDCYYNPLIEEYEPTIYTAHREADFTRNNCGTGYAGSAVSYSNDYTSTVDQQSAEDIADTNFPIDGQAFANDPANGATCTLIPPSSAAIQNQTSESMTVILVPLSGGGNYNMEIAPGNTDTIDLPPGQYNVLVTTHAPNNVLANINENIQSGGGNSTFQYPGLAAPISGYVSEEFM